MRPQLDVWEEAQSDLRELPSGGLKLAALEAIGEVLDNPRRGAELRDRASVGDLRGLRRVAFDEPSWDDKPRYRIVYRNEPDDAVVEVVAVIVVGLRESLSAYRAAATRLRAAHRRRARRR